MPRPKSPGGSTFSYYHQGGEIHCLKYGSFFSDQAALFAVMKAEEEFITQANRRLRIWIDLYETQLTDQVLSELARSLHRASPHIVKLAIVGCSGRDQRRPRRLARQSDSELPAPVRFFRDPEEAKTWLVNETSNE